MRFLVVWRCHEIRVYVDLWHNADDLFYFPFIYLIELVHIDLLMYFCTHWITYPHTYLRTGIAQSLLRLATGRTVQGLNSGKENIFLSFSLPSRPALGPTQPPVQWAPGFFPGGKAAGVLRWLPTPTSSEVKETADLHLYSPLCAFTDTLRGDDHIT